jgi:predicted amidohydrolase YtcJ
LPGFIDGHNHFLSGAYGKRGVRLVGCKTREELLGRIREYVTKNPRKEAYFGFGWTFAAFTDRDGTRQDLDAICKDKPIFLLNDDTHNAWFNTKALDRAEIGKNAPDPAPGRSFFKRGPDGSPSGIAVEPESWQGMALAIGLLGSKEMLGNCMERIFPMLPAAGITAFHDMGIWAPSLPEGYLGFEMLLEWEKAGKLPCRVAGVYGIRDAGEMPGPHVAALAQWRKKYRSDLVRVTGLKIWADGTFSTYTGVQLEPYASKPETRGESGWTAEVLGRWIDAAYAAGFDVHIHVQGDGSVRRSLDAFEAVARKRGPAGRRSVLHHLDVIHPDDLPRFKTLGLGGNATLEWLVSFWGDGLKVLGPAKVDKEYEIWTRLIDRGVNMTFGSDIPGTDPEELPPLYQMGVARARCVPGQTFRALPPLDRIPTLEQMLAGYTINGAYQMGLEDQIGSLEAGKLADLVVLEKNLFEVPANELYRVKVLLTMMDGRVVHLNRSAGFVGALKIP